MSIFISEDFETVSLLLRFIRRKRADSDFWRPLLYGETELLILFQCYEVSLSLFDRDGKRKYLNPTERLRFYRSVREADCPMERAFFLTLFFTGCRLSEALNLRAEDVDFSEKVLVFRTLKQRRSIRYRAIPIPEGLLESFSMLLGENKIDGRQPIWAWSRTTAWRKVGERMKSVKLDGVKATAKGLRHGFAIANISEGVPITTVQKWMGHSQLRTTSIYLDFIGADERKLAQRAWPKN